MDAASCGCVRKCRSRCGQGLAFTGRHLSDGSIGQDQAAEELDIVKRFAVNPSNCFDGHRKGGLQNLGCQDVQPRFDVLSQVTRFRFEFSVTFPGQPFDVGSNGRKVRSMAIRPKHSAMKSRSIM